MRKPAFYVLFYTELWELFGRFGVTAILVLYLTTVFHFPDARAFAIYSTFIALIYITPILGGILADKIVNKRYSVILGGSIMTLGNMLLIMPKFTQVCLWPEFNCNR